MVKKAGTTLLLLDVDAGSVRRLTASESEILRRWKSLAPGHRSTIGALLDTLDTRRVRKPEQQASPAPA